MCSETNKVNTGVTLRFLTTNKFKIGQYISAATLRAGGITTGSHGLVRTNLVNLGIINDKSHVIRLPDESDIKYVRSSPSRIKPREIK